MKLTFYKSSGWRPLHRSTLWLLLMLNFMLHASFYPAATQSNFYAPAKNLDFILRYDCLSDLFDKDQWENNKGRTFNKDGVALADGKKHPVNMCHYALFCYDQFNETRDAAYRKAFLAQANALRDSTFYVTIDDDKVAYPYNIVFHDLKPPWYSALAQSEAISVLIRYYAMTKDTTVLSLIHKVRNFMVSPQQGRCGTMSVTPEGRTWYEEYPESKQEKQVLNGFLVTVIALYEYSNLFPGNEEAKKQYEDALVTVKETFHFFDSGSWLKYNRGDKRLVANGYMKWQTLEFKYLYRITGDIYFKDIAMLVASYCFNKPYDTPGSRLKDYDFSVPLSLTKNGSLVFEGKTQPVDLGKELKNMESPFVAKLAEISKMTDQNVNTFATIIPDSVGNNESYIKINLKKEHQMGTVAISFAGLDSVNKPSLSLYYSDTTKNAKRNKVKIKNTISDTRTMNLYFEPVNATALTIVFNDVKKFKTLKITNVSVSAPAMNVPSDYWHYITEPFKGSDEVTLNFEAKGMKDLVVMYKTAKDEKSLSKELWKTREGIRKFPVKVKGTGDAYYRFLIMAEPNGKASLKNVHFSP